MSLNSKLPIELFNSAYKATPLVVEYLAATAGIPYGGDPARIFVFGQSAGACITAAPGW